MDRFARAAAFAAFFMSLALAGCGGGGGASASAGPADGGGGPTVAIQGISTPSTIAVVTPKNAQ